MRILLTILSCIILPLLSSCHRAGRDKAFAAGGDTLRLRYATNITIVDSCGYSVVTLRNPWDTVHTLHTYILVPYGAPLPHATPQGTVLRVPLSRSLVYSSVHTSLMGQLGAENAIAGVCDIKYFHMPFIRDGYASGRIADCGTSTNPDIERIIDLHPDAILLSPYQNNNGYGRIEKLGIPIIECADYMEESPLGRAEWMLFYGRLFGMTTRADSLFAVVDSSYNSLKSRAAKSQECPLVMSDMMYASTWYIAGGKSITGRLYTDAGGRYAFADEEYASALPMSIEKVYDRAGNADVWLIKYNREKDMTFADLAKENRAYTHFRPYRLRNVYGCNTGKLPFYEETPFRPDYLLSDLLRIFHGKAEEDSCNLRYFSRLSE